MMTKHDLEINDLLTRITDRDDKVESLSHIFKEDDDLDYSKKEFRKRLMTKLLEYYELP